MFYILEVSINMDEFKKAGQIAKILMSERKRALTAEEQTIFNDWLNEDDGNISLYNKLKKDSSIPAKLESLSKFNKDKAFSLFVKRSQTRITKNIYQRILKYAAILIPFIFASWLIYRINSGAPPEVQLVKTEIKPGTSKAILKLGDGTIVNLETEKELIANFDEAIIRNSNNKITYNLSDKKVKSKKIQFNTIEIPKGGEYQLILSDGTKVWLNSGTSIKYPITFAKDIREVYLEYGEAFFEVTKNTESPFIVHTSKMNVKVLGTSFNVRAYSDENFLATTLVTGKVTINQLEAEKEYTLNMNEQAIISDLKTIIKGVDVDQYVAWKNGRILFEENTLGEIFKDLSRWYNIDIIYSNPNIKELRFSIDIERYEDLGEILGIIELTKKVKFEIKENLVTIKKG